MKYTDLEVNLLGHGRQQGERQEEKFMAKKSMVELE
jgi:hypothetical protein